MPNKNRLCRVCGNVHYDFPWGEDGTCASFEICECCGTTFGYEDATLKAIKKKRKDWVDSGGKWNTESEKPEKWNLEDALKKIPDEYK